MNPRIADRFTSPPVQLAISPVAQAYQVGQAITMRVIATGRQDASIREASIRLVMKVWRHAPHVVVGQWGSVPGSPGPHRTVTGGPCPLRLTGDLKAGARAECQATVPNWAQAPTGGRSTGRRIEYAIRAEAKLATGRIVRSDTPVQLVSGAELYQDVEGTVRSRRTRRCDIEVVAPTLRARLGEPLRGTVRVTPRQPLHAQSVLVCLLKTQDVSPTQSVGWRRTLASDADLDSPREFGFQTPGLLVPTMITPDLSVHWHLRVVVRYGRRAKDRLDIEVNIYSGPG